jgi:hypothetical protein
MVLRKLYFKLDQISEETTIIASSGNIAALISIIGTYIGKIWLEKLIELERFKTATKIQESSASLDATNRALQHELGKGFQSIKSNLKRI